MFCSTDLLNFFALKRSRLYIFTLLIYFYMLTLCFFKKTLQSVTAYYDRYSVEILCLESLLWPQLKIEILRRTSGMCHIHLEPAYILANFATTFSYHYFFLNTQQESLKCKCVHLSAVRKLLKYEKSILQLSFNIRRFWTGEEVLGSGGIFSQNNKLFYHKVFDSLWHDPFYSY